MQRSSRAAFLAVVAACGTPPAAPANGERGAIPARSTVGDASVAMAPPATTSPATTSGLPADPQPIGPQPESERAAAAVATSAVAPFDPFAWLAAHGVPSATDDRIGASACSVVRVGRPIQEALLCIGGEPMEGSAPGGESVFPLLVAVPEKGKLHIALRVPISAGPEDRLGPAEPSDPNHGQYVELEATVAPDGMRLSIREHPGAGCAETLRRYREINTKDSEQKGVLGPHIAMVERACRSRGTYMWQGGRFVLATGPSSP
jgi:hypothetical protein